jgi:N-acyl homoserine lactone hydrolase
MRLYALHAGGERADMAALYPFDDAVGTKIEMSYFIYLIQHPQGDVVFDTGGHPALARER